MFNDTEIRKIIGTTAYGSDGDKIGKVGQVFLDDVTGQPEFATVNTGLFGTNESFVPLGSAKLDGDTLRLPFTKDEVKNAPNVDIEQGHMDENEEAELLTYYAASSPDGWNSRTGKNETGSNSKNAGKAGDASKSTSGDEMTISEERLNVGTASHEAGRARLRKYVTTETETVTVPVRKEKAVLEREPIDPKNAGEAATGAQISEEEVEVVLREERPVVEKKVEAVERVRLGTETVTDEETVSEEVRKEHVDVDGDIKDRRR